MNKDDRQRVEVVVDAIAYAIRGVVFPFAGLLGIAWEEFYGETSLDLLTLYAIMLGIGAPTAIRTITDKVKGHNSDKQPND
jgi:hypothetical protein